jgi:HlyD family secretion protein
LGVIASTTGLDVIFKLDEADLALVKAGQKAMVSGPGFGGSVLTGMVSSIGGEAETATGGGKATFEARIRLHPLSESAARDVRIGMTANIAIMTYENRDAIVVPPQAVQGAAPQAYVMVRAGSGAASERRPVAIGKVGPSAVEILSGLRAGETVVWTVAAPQTP